MKYEVSPSLENYWTLDLDYVLEAFSAGRSSCIFTTLLSDLFAILYWNFSVLVFIEVKVTIFSIK
jgi:hypothetical protein